MDSKDSRYQKVSAAGILIAMGIIYGDIGTSPLYTLRFIVGDHVITEDLIFGGLSCVFWTLTLNYHHQICLPRIKCR
ncbi:MAG: KUP/HAK/KT family potassium transporter [Cytophagales bacterium]|nr:KUP/HAK/KT family potassium transporter [Cytophagales bacterium]